MARWSRGLRRLYGGFGIVWIGVVFSLILLSPKVPAVWKATGVVWGGVGLVHMVAALVGREGEWGPWLDRLWRVGIWVVWVGFAVMVLQLVVFD